MTACCQKKSPKCFETRHNQLRSSENFGEGSVDCLKITADNSSDNRVHTSDARLIKVIHAMPRRKARSLHPSIFQCQGAGLEARVSAPLQCSDTKLKARVSYHINEGTQSLRLVFQHYSSAQTRSSRPTSSIISIAKRRAQAYISVAEEPCVSVITTPVTGSSTAHIMREVNPIMEDF